MKKNLIITISILCFVFALDCLILNKASQKHTEDYLNESLLLATSTYATSRVINAGVSTLQESTISMSPAGVGISVPPGQILDPINDATERLSDLCVQSIGLLGVQRILLEVINHVTIIPMYIGLVCFLVVTLFTKQKKISTLLFKFVLLLALLRICSPIMCSIGITANDHYFTPSIEKNLRNLTGAKDIITTEFENSTPELNFDPSSNEDMGPIDSILMYFAKISASGKKYFAVAKFRLEKTGEAILFLKDNSHEIISDLTSLFASILGKIVVQVLLLPLATLALIRWIFKQVSESSLDEFVDYLRQKLRNQESSPDNGSETPVA
jgi:hypothetical protein